jgi:hypothetical protein
MSRDRPALPDNISTAMHLAEVIFAELERQEARPNDLSAGDMTDVIVCASFDLIALIETVRGHL